MKVWIVKTLIALVFLTGAALSRAAGDFQPGLGQAKELIAGKETPATQIPRNAKELQAYPLASERPRELLAEVPGKPFRQVIPTPLASAWWKYPFYAVLGLPRDLADAVFGGISFVPLINLPLVYLPYEVVPSQVLLRDPRDWHRWPGQRNNRGHGMIDSISWGWFPSARSWHFTYSSPGKARKYQLYNEKLQKQLEEENRKIDVYNQAISARTREARAKAFEAIRAGNGREAALRMVAYHQVYPLDEGAFALYVTSLALYLPDGPEWVGPALWSSLNAAQPRSLSEAEKLLSGTVKDFPNRVAPAKALIYTQLLLGKEKAALATAQTLQGNKPDDPLRHRLVFETALAARDAKVAEAGLSSIVAQPIDPSSDQANEQAARQSMTFRLQLLRGEIEPARKTVADLYARQPEDAYLNYYMGVVYLLIAQGEKEPSGDFKRALPLIEKSSLLATGPALRTRATEALSYVRGVVEGIAEKPEFFAVPTPASK